MKIAFTLFFFAVVTLLFFWQSYRLIRRALPGFRDALSSRSWPSVTGKVTIVNVVMSSEKIKRRHQTFYRPWVQTSYSVDGKSYVCDHFTFNDELISAATRDKAAAMIKSYQVDQNVNVYYDRSNPAKSVLEAGKLGLSMPSLVWGVVNFLLGFLSLLGMYAVLKP